MSGKLLVEDIGRSAVSGVSLVFCFVVSYVFVGAVNSYLRLPCSVSFEECYSLVSRCIRWFFGLVSQIFLGRRLTKIGQSVIVRDAVDVIYFKGWPRSGYQNPYQTMSEIIFPGNPDRQMAKGVSAPRWLSRVSRVGVFGDIASIFARENTRRWIVIQDTSHIFGGEVIAGTFVPAYRWLSHMMRLRHVVRGGVGADTPPCSVQPSYVLSVAA